MMGTTLENSNYSFIRPITAGLEKERKVFVTQLNERDEEEYNPVNAVINNSNTESKFKNRQLQQTVLLKYRINEEEMNKNLREKRIAFQKSIRLCKEKQEELLRKKEENERKIQQFEKFINEKENKRKKALQRYQVELKFKLQKILEYDILLTQFEELNDKHFKLQMRLEKGKKYKDYLTKVIDLLPDNYLGPGESKYTSLMLRYQTLEESNHDLFDSLMNNADKLKAVRSEYERLVVEHNFNKITISSKLSELQKIKDEMDYKNTKLEENIVNNGEKYRKELLELADIFRGIDNLAEKCQTKFSLPIKDLTLSEKLDLIQDFMREKNIVLKTVKSNMTEDEYQDALVREIDD